MEFFTNYHKREGKDRRDLDDSEAISFTIKSNFLLNLKYIDYDFGYHRTTVFRNRK